MNVTPTQGFFLVWAVAILAAVAVGITARVSGRDGYELGAADEKCHRALEGLASRRARRAAAALAEENDFGAWLEELATTEQAERLAVTGEMQQLGGLTITGNFSQNFRRDRSGLTTTGQFRALTDQYIAEMAEQEENYRRGITS